MILRPIITYIVRVGASSSNAGDPLRPETRHIWTDPPVPEKAKTSGRTGFHFRSRILTPSKAPCAAGPKEASTDGLTDGPREGEAEELEEPKEPKEPEEPEEPMEGS